MVEASSMLVTHALDVICRSISRSMSHAADIASELSMPLLLGYDVATIRAEGLSLWLRHCSHLVTNGPLEPVFSPPPTRCRSCRKQRHKPFNEYCCRSLMPKLCQAF